MSIGTLAGEAYRQPHRTLYGFTVASRALMGMQELRMKLSTILNELSKTKQHILITNRGQVAAVVVPLAWYQEAAAKLGEPLDITVPIAQVRE
jgi:prevent-host-death family protein